MNTDVLNLPDDIPVPKFRPFQEVRRKLSLHPDSDRPYYTIVLYGLNWSEDDDEPGAWYYSDGIGGWICEDLLEPLE